MDNERTLAAYNDNVAAYIATTVQHVDGDLRDWLDAATAGLDVDAAILEVGCGFGRDADYLTSRGYTVTLTDASTGFVDWLRGAGRPAAVLNLLTDPIPGEWDLILADAVLLHFTEAECLHVLSKVHAALRSGGRFAFTMKAGTGSGWSEEKIGAQRYFTYWSLRRLTDAVRQAGFSSVTELHQGWDSGEQPHAQWLHVVAHA